MPLEIAEKIKILHKDIDLLKNNIDWDRSNSELKILIKTSETDGFWDDPKNAQNVMKEIKLKENMINLVNKINQDYHDLKDLIELAESENDSDLIKELNNSLDNLIIKSSKYKIETMFSNQNDFSNCFLEIHAGAGGTEAQDWALMLQRMYFRWAEKKGFKVKIIEESKKKTFSKNRGIKIGLLYNKNIDLLLFIQKKLEKNKIHFGRNYPYSGFHYNYTIDRLCTNFDLKNITIEIRNDLICYQKGIKSYVKLMSNIFEEFLNE